MPGKGGSLGSIGDAQFAEDVADVVAHRAFDSGDNILPRRVLEQITSGTGPDGAVFFFSKLR